jgi:hypothetical protein
MCLMFLLTFTPHACGYFIPQLFGNVSVAVCPLCPIKVSFKKQMILISPYQPNSAESTIRTRQNVRRTNSTDKYGRQKQTRLISGGGRWKPAAYGSVTRRHCDVHISQHSFVSSSVIGRIRQCKSKAICAATLTLALTGHYNTNLRLFRNPLKTATFCTNTSALMCSV